jgi:hypothetical protein
LARNNSEPPKKFFLEKQNYGEKKNKKNTDTAAK